MSKPTAFKSKNGKLMSYNENGAAVFVSDDGTHRVVSKDACRKAHGLGAASEPKKKNAKKKAKAKPSTRTRRHSGDFWESGW